MQYSEVGRICAVTHILGRWKHHFSQFLNVPGVNDARQNAVHKTELLMSKYSTLEVEMANEEKMYEAAGSDQILSECSKREAEQCILRFINIRRWADKFCFHCNIFMYIRHMWIKLVLCSHVVSLPSCFTLNTQMLTVL